MAANYSVGDMRPLDVALGCISVHSTSNNTTETGEVARSLNASALSETQTAQISHETVKHAMTLTVLSTC